MSTPGVRTSKAFTRSRACAAIAPRRQHAAARERRAEVPVEHEVVGDRERRDQTVLAAVLGHVADAQLLDLARRAPADRGAADRDQAGDDLAHPGDGLDQLALAVALHAREPEDLAGAHVEVAAGDDRHAAVVGDREVPHLQHRLAGLGGLLGHLEDDLAADHQRREVAGRRGLGVRRPDHPPAAQDGDAVGDRQHLAQLVGDEDDRLALVDQGAHDLEELVDLGRRQHRGGLVEDQDVGVAVQRLDQLDALLRADRQLADQRVGIDRAGRTLATARGCATARCRGPGRGPCGSRCRAPRSRRRSAPGSAGSAGAPCRCRR